MAGVTAADRERVRRRLREDYEFFIDEAGAAKIVTKRGELVVMRLKRPQRRLVRALKRQREAGQPQRAIMLKSRQVGMSTVAQVLGSSRAAQTPNHLALTVAQDRKTVAALFSIGERCWANMPAQIRPPAARAGGTLEVKYLQFGEASQQLRRQGIMGLNSSYETATAKTAAAARGRTIGTLHFSEIAFYAADDAVLGIQNGVPDTPESLILKESTANGHNWFKDEWDLAEAGESGYYAMFSPWFEEDEYRRPFANEQDRMDFEALVGASWPANPDGVEDEPDLLELIPDCIREWAEEDGEEPPSPAEIYLRTLEHLHWRRWAIQSKTQGKVAKFHQEYPSTPEEAFLSTGRKVFDANRVRRALKLAEDTDPVVPSVETPGPVLGLFRAVDMRPTRVRRGVTMDVPHGVEWVPRRRRERGEAADWRRWCAPTKGQWRELEDGSREWIPEGQYVVTLDPASGEEDEQGTEHANHAITVIDHRTRRLVAEYESQIDPDLLALEVLLAAHYWNRAWVVVERTGGYGLSVLRALALDYKYPRVFEQESHDKRVEDRTDRLGFSTDSVSKPLIEARLIELLRDNPEVFVSRRLLGQMLTYIRDKRGRTKPEAGKLSDVLMSFGIGQHVASLRPIRPERPGGGKPNRGASGGPRTFQSRNERRGGR